MDKKKRKRFLKEWCRFAVRDATGQTFGWPTVVSAVLLTHILKRMGVSTISDQVENGLAVAAVSWLVALAAAVVLTGIRAYRVVKPLVVTITDELRSPDFAFNEQFKGYNATAVVTNRSSAHLKDCVAYVMNAPDVDGTPLPRFVEKFDLPPECKKYVYFGYWFSRESPNPDDPEINLSGPTAAGFGGNRCKVPSPSRLHVRIQAQDVDSKDVCCDVWIDTTARRLRAVEAQQPDDSNPQTPNREIATSDSPQPIASRSSF
ncbi:hypothetical protein PQR65_12375 [Paraburkholderia nemoris]|uniref:hypothetical protein n=1 Tax=Paraburkholderia nemoris TaxID=2793076 RepID=UPI0038BC4DC5